MNSCGAEKYNEYYAGYDNVKIAYDCWTKDWPASGITFFSQNTSGSRNFVKTRLGQGNGTGTFGPEIGIAEAMMEQNRELFLIKFACGGSNLKDDWLGKTSIMYRKMMEYINRQMGNLVDMGYAPTIKAFCWMQGEGDSYPGYHNHYLENLRQFVGDLREDLYEYAGKKTLPFVDAGISSASTWQYYKEVNEAKVAFSEENEMNFYIDTIGAGMHTDKEPWYEPDINHYDSDSEILLGRLFAEQFAPFLKE